RLVKLLPAVAFLLLFTLVACTGHEEEITPTGKGDALVTFSLRLPGESVPDTRALPNTRALSEDGENAVTEIDVLVFGKNGGTYVYTAGCSGSQITGTGNAKTFTVTLRRGEYDLVVLAGARSIIEAATL
ncbi:fimbrial protein, partial [Bacteroides sp. 51]|uniref:fimbrial protein n=1 Tax=Bacteroides sp. 51 TaxID=2302938 RepID=UPI0013CF8C04